MAGARRIDDHDVSYAEAAAAALRAGCDLVLLCNQSVDGGQAVDALLEGMAALNREGAWQPNPASEVRRLALLPQTPPTPWDELMHAGAYRHALDRLP